MRDRARADVLSFAPPNRAVARAAPADVVRQRLHDEALEASIFNLVGAHDDDYYLGKIDHMEQQNRDFQKDIEKLKLAKDPTNAWTDLYEFAGAIRAGTLDYARRPRPNRASFRNTKS